MSDDTEITLIQTTRGSRSLAATDERAPGGLKMVEDSCPCDVTSRQGPDPHTHGIPVAPPNRAGRGVRATQHGRRAEHRVLEADRKRMARPAGGVGVWQWRSHVGGRATQVA